MVHFGFKTIYFSEEEDFESTKKKLTELLSTVDNDLVENEDREEPFLDWFMTKNKKFLEENYGSFLELLINSVKEHINKTGYAKFKYSYLNEELVYGYAITFAVVYE